MFSKGQRHQCRSMESPVLGTVKTEQSFNLFLSNGLSSHLSVDFRLFSRFVPAGVNNGLNHEMPADYAKGRSILLTMIMEVLKLSAHRRLDVHFQEKDC